MQWSLSELFENTTLITLSIGGGLVVYLYSNDKGKAIVASIATAGGVKLYQSTYKRA